MFYTDQFVIPLPEKHTFPVQKYTLLRKLLLASNIVQRENFHIPRAATLEEITRIHDDGYIRRVLNGELTPKEIRPIGLP